MAARAKVWPGARVAVLSPTPTHPQDFGNRKRIYRVCSRYREEGAHVTFIHYPSELEWRGRLPLRAQREMSECWSQHFTVAPTRALHDGPRGRDHTIDEWWDYGIGDFLTWLFSVEAFDIFIVNYPWLSKALEYAPKTTFKVLDTHDKFSGRRHMLESLGLNPEFFYTTEDQERIALDRADLVWAIKTEEAAELQRLTSTPVLALPHLDPMQPLKRAEPDAQGYFRVGVIGARNNVNRMNITEFLHAAEPVFRSQFAPVKVVVAGTVCSLLENVRSPFVDLAGRVENVEDFYRSVDCVAVPMRTSTGLKIKTGEALSYGMPVVSLAHAFEGYEPAHELHMLEGFKEMACALTELSFAPRARLDMLAEVSHRAHAKTAWTIADAFRRSDTLAREKRQLILMVVDSRAFVDGSIFNLVLNSVHEYLSGLGVVTVLVVRGQAEHVLRNAGAIDRFRRVAVAEDLSDAGALRGLLAELSVEVCDVAEYLGRAQPAVVVADALHPALQAGATPEAVLISRTEMIALSEGHGDFDVLAQGYARAYAATPALSPEIAGRAAETGAEHFPTPCFWRSREITFQRARDMTGIRTVALLGTPGTAVMAMAAAMARAWKLKPVAVHGLDEQGDEDLPGYRADDFLFGIVAGHIAPPHFAVDLSRSQPGLPLCRELLDRLHVPTVAVSGVAIHRSFAARDNPLRATTEQELWNSFRFLALESAEAQAKVFRLSWQDHESDRGWAWLWRYCTKLFEIKDPQFA